MRFAEQRWKPDAVRGWFGGALHASNLETEEILEDDSVGWICGAECSGTTYTV